MKDYANIKDIEIYKSPNDRFYISLTVLALVVGLITHAYSVKTLRQIGDFYTVSQYEALASSK